jgi:hypothetical protein
MTSLIKTYAHGESSGRVLRLYSESLQKILDERRTKAAIPVTSVLGAFHVATRYLKLPVASVEEKLVKMLETKSPAFYSRASLEEAISAIKYATLFRVESWDGYIIEISKKPRKPYRVHIRQGA